MSRSYTAPPMRLRGVWWDSFSFLGNLSLNFAREKKKKYIYNYLDFAKHTSLKLFSDYIVMLAVQSGSYISAH
jgi:hypothetical protein